MAASTVIPLTKKSQESFIQYYRTLQNNQNANRGQLRSRMEQVDRKYQREQDYSIEQSRAKAANNAGDSTRFQNMTVPVVMPQVEAAVTYQTSVFLTGHPLFGVVSSPAYIDAATQMNTVLTNQAKRGGWTRELILFFRNGFKYNFAPLEIDWSREVTYTVETDTAVSVKEGKPTKVLWAGNRIRSLNVYNTFVDTRVPATEVYKDGEFAGHTELMSKIKLKSFVAELPDKIIANLKPAFESGKSSLTTTVDSTSQGYYVPEINSEISQRSYRGEGTNWLEFAGLTGANESEIQYRDSYEVTTLYCKVLPAEFELRVPESKTPQIYKLIIINHEYIIYCERQTNAHNYLPILIGQPLEDGLDYQTKSLAENASGFQDLTSTYMDSIIASRRRAISDRCLYDPSRISSAVINSANPSAKMPVKPNAYGKPLSESVYPFPYREDQSASSMQQIQMLLGMANQLSGQNQASQGQFVKGNKTLHEFDSVMNNANGRDQMASILIEHQVFTPLKLMLKLNILQYQGGTTLYDEDTKTEVEIDPVQLRTAVLDFDITDGLTPASKLINSESMATALQVLGSSPQIAAGYNLSQVFSYFMKTQGAKIQDFEKSPQQQAYEQALSSWQGLAQLAVEKGVNPENTLGPMPKPMDYGYDPQSNKPAPEGAVNSQTQSQPGVLG